MAVGGKDAVGLEIVFVEVVVVVLVLLAVVIVIVIIGVGAAIASGRWLRHGVCRSSFDVRRLLT